MGPKNPPKPAKSTIVVNQSTNTRGATKRKAVGTEAVESNHEMESQVVYGSSQTDSQIIGGQIEGALDLSQRSGVPLDSRNTNEDMDMTTDDISVPNARASTDRLPGYTNELGEEILAAISSVSTAVQSVSERVEQTQHDVQQAQRGLHELKSSMTKAVAGLKASIDNAVAGTSSSVQEIRRHVDESNSSVTKMLQAISDAMTAVQASVSDLSADNTVVYMAQPGPSSGVMGVPRTNSSAQMAAGTPTEYCQVTFNDEIYRLLLTHQEMTMITAATTLREFIRRILCKYHTIPQLQRFTLRGVGANREPRPILDAWLVELIIRAAETWRPFPQVPADERPDGPMNTAKRMHDANLSARVRRLISDILQYYRETRDPEGNMRRRQPNVGGRRAEQGEHGEDLQEDPGENDQEHLGQDDQEGQERDSD